MVIAGAVTATLAGCGSSAATDQPPNVAASAAVATQSSTAIPTALAVAAQQYLAVVTPFNAAAAKNAADLKPLSARMAPWADVVPVMRPYVVALSIFRDGVFKIDFPAAVSPQASALASSVTKELAAWSDFLSKPNAVTWQRAQDANHEFSGAAGALRMALHLPPPPIFPIS